MVAHTGHTLRPSSATRMVLAGIRLYQLARAGRPSPCRFTPTCSAFATEAFVRHGIWKGGALTVRRVVRCRPWGGYGVDPVPD